MKNSKVELKETSMIEEEKEEKEFEFDEVRGGFGKKPKMAILNKTKLSKYEMDDLFSSEDLPEPVDADAD